MIALLLKELRLASDVFAGAIVLLLASFPLALLGVAMQGVVPFPWKAAVAGGCVLNQYTMVLTGALLGAVAFAREREEGTTHFLAALPIAVARQHTAKVVTVLSTWLTLWLVNGLILVVLATIAWEGISPLIPFMPRMATAAIVSFCALGCASLAGCFISNTTAAAFAGLGAIGCGTVGYLLWARWAHTEDYFGSITNVALLTVGISSLLLSSSAFGREPSTRPRRVRSFTRARWPGDACPSSTWGPMAALLWKDRRLMAPVLLIGLFLVALPYVAAVGNACLAANGAAGFRVASLAAMAVGWCVLPLWGASAAATEWSTSTFQFLAYLPISAKRVLATKILVALIPSVFLIAGCAMSFIWAHARITADFTSQVAGSWDDFTADGFLSGAVAYTCALPVTFAVGWFFAGMLQRRILGMILGVVSGPVAMATWALTSMPGGYIQDHASPIQAVGIHAMAMLATSALLVTMGTAKLAHGALHASSRP